MRAAIYAALQPKEVDVLWISREGGAMPEVSIRGSIEKRTLATFRAAIPIASLWRRGPVHALAAALSSATIR